MKQKLNLIVLLTLIGYLTFNLTPSVCGFITFFHRFNNKNLLIKHVHKPSWKIGYRYEAECKPQDRRDKEMEAIITRALQAWLTPLRELQPDRPIVDSFSFQLQEDFQGDDPFAEESLEGLSDIDVRVTFLCTKARSIAVIGSHDFPSDIFVTLVNNTMVSLIHELGHAFGLVDTYLHWGITSNGGLSDTVGTQPSSVMSDYHPPPYLGEDDKRGIIWLYKHFHEGLELEDCFFPDYVLEKEPLGCRPKHPLIFEVKHNPPHYARQLLKQDPSIDVNAQDVADMTALHYAAMYGKEAVVKDLLEHKDIKLLLRDTQGRTALDIARGANQTGIIKLLQAVTPPRAVEDVNGDGLVNILDMVMVATNFGETGTHQADVDSNGVVDIRDLVKVAGMLGAAAGTP